MGTSGKNVSESIKYNYILIWQTLIVDDDDYFPVLTL